MIAGGLVSRFLYDRRQDGVYLHKVPLVRWQENLRYTSSTHTLYPVALAAETGVLLHFKYMADIIDRARMEAMRKQYWQGAKRYAEFNRRLEASQAIDFRCELTERFRSTAQLVELGLMRTSPALDALAATLRPAFLPARLAQPDMTSAAAPIAVVLPCRNARHLLWRSLASLAAQSLPPAQILVLDRSSADDTGDWLRVRWPGVELCSVAADADTAALGLVIADRVSAPRVAVLPPGERWRPSHLEALAAQPEASALLATGNVAATLPWPADEGPVSSPQALADAVASLPAGDDTILLDLRAAGMPAGLVDLLGLAAVVGPTGRRLHA
jgi:hypothetical protein